MILIERWLRMSSISCLIESRLLRTCSANLYEKVCSLNFISFVTILLIKRGTIVFDAQLMIISFIAKYH